MQRSDLLVWMDLEMTSIDDVNTDRITEIAVILTDANLNIVAEGPDIVIHVNPKLFECISPSARAVLDLNGLEDITAQSTISAQEAQERVLTFLKEWVVKNSAPLCGNSIHMDRHFLRIQMRPIEDYLFYRCIDVSSLKELARRWAPEIYNEVQRNKIDKKHRALDDIKQSIDELKFYRKTFLKT